MGLAMFPQIGARYAKVLTLQAEMYLVRLDDEDLEFLSLKDSLPCRIFTGNIYPSLDT